jgi:hypothetical protein
MAHGGGKRCSFPGGCGKHIVRLGLCQQHGVATHGAESFANAVKPRRTRKEMELERLRSNVSRLSGDGNNEDEDSENGNEEHEDLEGEEGESVGRNDEECKDDKSI